MSLVPFVLLTLLVVLREYSFATERREWTSERRELLNRIQRPEWLPVASEGFEMPEPEPDEFNMIGTISEAVDE